VIRFLTRNLPIALLGLPPALAGTLLWWLPYRAVPLITRTVDPEPSVFATVQILAGAVFFPLWLVALTALTWELAGGRMAAVVGPLALLLGPLTILFWDWWSVTAADVGAFLRRCFSSELHRALVADREALRVSLRELGPLPREASAARQAGLGHAGELEDQAPSKDSLPRERKGLSRPD